jgi:hypothetical protein
VVAVAFPIGCLYAWEATASLRGQMAARRDVADGHYNLLVYGLPVEWREDDARILQQRYDIRMKAVAGCTVSGGLIDYVDGYDRYVAKKAKGKFGRDVFKESADEAERAWRLRSGVLPK